MPPKRPKLPTQTKAELMSLVLIELKLKHRDPFSAMEYLLNFFHSADLVEILKELKEYEAPRRHTVRP